MDSTTAAPHRPGRRTTKRAVGAVGAAGITAALFLGAAAPAQAATADQSPSAVDAQVAKSIVQLEIDYSAYIDYPDKDGNWHRSAKPVVAAFGCTGWFADTTGDIVTAGHCVDPNDGVDTALIDQFLSDNGITDQDTVTWAEQTFTIENASGGSTADQAVYAYQSPSIDGAVLTDANWTVVHVQAFKPANDEDLALLNVVTTKPTPALPVASSTQAVGDAVTSIGFVGVIGQSTAEAEASYKTGSISSRQVLPNGTARLEVNADIAEGMSGGPTIDPSGEVVGVNVSGFDVPGSFNYITDTDALRRFLTLQGVHLSTGSSSSGPSTSKPRAAALPTASGVHLGKSSSNAPVSSGIPSGAVILGGLLGLAAAGGAALTILGTRRKGRSDPEPSPVGAVGGTPNAEAA